MNAVLLEASRKELTAVALWQRQRSLSESVRKIEGIAAGLFLTQAYDIIRAVYDVEPTEDAEKTVDALVAAIVAALAARRVIDASRLATGYETAILAALRRVELRFGIRLDLTDIDAAAWVASHSRETMQGLNETTANRLRNPLRVSLNRSREPIDTATAAAVTIAGISQPRAALVGSTEGLYGYGYGDLAAAGVFAAAGIRMLKQWNHTDGCLCPHCTLNDGAVVPIHEAFPSGAMNIPAHPHCGCFIDIYPDLGRLILPVLVLGQRPYFNQQAA